MVSNMKLSRPSATIVRIVIGGALLSSCTGNGNPQHKADTSAGPGRFVTLIGTGPDGGPDSDPGWLEDPVDIVPDINGGLLALTGQFSRVFLIRPNGSKQQLSSLAPAGGTLSMAKQADGSLLIAKQSGTGKLMIRRFESGKSPSDIASVPAAKNPRSVHLVTTGQGDVLLLKDGSFFHQTKSGQYSPLSRFDGIDPKATILAATADGPSLLLALPNKLVWIKDNHAERQVPMAWPLHPQDGASVVPDGAGGAYVSGRSPYVAHISAKGRRGVILLGIGNTPEACGDGRISGPTGDTQERYLGEATALSVTRNELYVADSICHRILAIGLPAREHTGPGR